jgi:hypothetical protein
MLENLDRTADASLRRRVVCCAGGREKGARERQAARKTLGWLRPEQSYTAFMSRALIVAAALAVAPAAYAEARFFTAIEDLPLAPGLEEAGPAFWFDDANGRIIGVVARGWTDPYEVRRFYLDTLPALGWAYTPGAGVDGELVFQRGRERLALDISPYYGGGVQVETRLFIRPAPSRND